GCYLFFFFQAEDGIRDGHVTGVQTCALPIWTVQWSDEIFGGIPYLIAEHLVAPLDSPADGLGIGIQHDLVGIEAMAGFGIVRPRSEERRVGKGWRVGVLTDASGKMRYNVMKE